MPIQSIEEEHTGKRLHSVCFVSSCNAWKKKDCIYKFDSEYSDFWRGHRSATFSERKVGRKSHTCRAAERSGTSALEGLVSTCISDRQVPRRETVHHLNLEPSRIFDELIQ